MRAARACHSELPRGRARDTREQRGRVSVRVFESEPDREREREQRKHTQGDILESSIGRETGTLESAKDKCMRARPLHWKYCASVEWLKIFFAKFCSLFSYF